MILIVFAAGIVGYMWIEGWNRWPKNGPGHPSSQTKIMAGDTLIAMGRDEDLERLREVLVPKKSGAGA